MNTIKILGKEYEILDTLEYITLADSFVKNKIGSGHGEAKLYVGNESDKIFSFFENMTDLSCFFIKKDFKKFLEDAQEEYLNPQQEYLKKDELPSKFQDLKEKLNNFAIEKLEFKLTRVNVNPPRVYMNSESVYYNFMRDVALPNISYLSILKIKDNSSNIFYYFRIFIDYRTDIIGYKTLEEERQEEEINDREITTREKEKLIKARVGQGIYREKLLEECPFCPFTLVNDERLLIASHIKPWAKSDDKEKIDPKNGFMFTPTYDKLFDRGFITFADDKSLIVSPWISPMNQKRLAIYTGKVIDKLNLDEKRKEYLKYHRETIFKA
ncbi:HNH endonuclease [Fusobacterium nucleatum]|uniref:HNH endonuclease n=1 Tax=Fusobacterium nucleatum TaxID=851 RepID=UPI0030CE457E